MEAQVKALQDEVKKFKAAQAQHEPVVKSYMTHKTNIPRMTAGMTYQAYKHAVDIWQYSTEVPPAKRALILLNEMPDSDNHGGLKRIIPERATIAALMKDDGVNALLEAMEDVMVSPTFVRLMECFEKFKNLKQDRETSYERFITEVRELKRVAKEEFNFEISPVIIAAKVLRGCNAVNASTIGIITQGIDLKPSDQTGGTAKPAVDVETQVINSCRNFVATMGYDR